MRRKNCNITINTWHKILETNLSNGKKKYVYIPRSFLVNNVCNQGKNLCSPCIFFSQPCQMKVTSKTWARFRLLQAQCFFGCEMKMGTRGPLKHVLCKEHPAVDFYSWIVVELCIFNNLARWRNTCQLVSSKTLGPSRWATYHVSRNGKFKSRSELLRQTFGVARLKNWKTNKIKCLNQAKWSRGRTVGVVTRLRDGRSGVQIPIRVRDTFLLENDQTGSEAHPNSYSFGTEVLSREESVWGTKLTIPSIAEIKNEWSHTSTARTRLHGVDRKKLYL
jgi:hypothetical protein